MLKCPTMRPVSALLLPLAMSACGPSVYGPNACIEAGAKEGTQVVYQAPGTTGVCLPPQAVIYITCLRDMNSGKAAAGVPPAGATHTIGSANGPVRIGGEADGEYTDVARLAAVEYCAKAAGLPAIAAKERAPVPAVTAPGRE